MKNVAINLNHKGVDYTSEYTEMDDDEYLKLSGLIKQAAGGELTYLTFKSVNKNLFFSKKILRNSIISLVHKQ